MSTNWSWRGSRWWRVDLHAHSPASQDFRSEADRDSPDWKSWIVAARDAGLHAVAITDHNTAEAVDELKRTADEVENGPIIFPGVELTASDGTHLLLVLDPKCGKKHVDEFLVQASVPVDQHGKKDARSTLNVEDILSLKLRNEGVIIGAHVNASNGLLQLSGQQRIKALSHLGLAAVEIKPGVPSDNSDVRLEDAASWLDRNQPVLAAEGGHSAWRQCKCLDACDGG